MVSSWLLCCLLISQLSDADVPDTDFGLQLPGNDTGCKGDPHGDRLQGLCDEPGMSCCLYTDPDGDCESGLCLDIEEGDEKSIGALLPQLPVDNITYFHMKNFGFSQFNLRNANVCLLYNLQSLRLDLFTPVDIDDINCLSQLRLISLIANFNVGITNSTFHGLDHLWRVSMLMLSISVSPAGMMHLVDSTKQRLIITIQAGIKHLDVWPLCLAQKQNNLVVDLRNNRIFDFHNTLSPALCNIEEAVQADVEIYFSQNAIAHVSDIASGWGFDSLHHFILALIRQHSTTFPIFLEGNPFVCDCRDLELYQMLRDPGYNMSLTNLASLTCVSPQKLKGRRFDSLLDSELNCDSPSLLLILSVSICGTVVLAVSLVGFLFYNRIRLYRWSGYTLHPWDLDECDNEDKEFDVFVSHASEDEQWTLDLIEELEARDIKVLFHQRDFEAGMSIIENIAEAVSKSKRTICVLSHSFVASPLCSWEFITVFNDDIMRHQRRLLLIVKERVAWESLSLAMQRYMRDFTYIDAESPYFMDKLLYSLPVKRLGVANDQGTGETGDSRDCQPVPSQLGHCIQDTERTPLL